MFARISKRFTYANVTATLALVFAMTGGAYAAGHYLINSTGQINPKVLKSLKGKAGSPGAAGPQGPQGPAGAAGAGTPGPQGTAGAEGKEGKEGHEGKQGQPGAPGPEGNIKKTLPSGATETGTWSYDLPTSEGEPEGGAPISFAIPLEKPLDETHVHYVKSEAPEPPEACKGTPEAPTAAKGNLCVYEAHSSGLNEEEEVLPFQGKPTPPAENKEVSFWPQRALV